MDRFIVSNRKDDRKLTQNELDEILKDDDYKRLTFTNCDLSNLSFSRANLYKSIFDHCTLNYTGFNHADLMLAVFRNCIGTQINFCAADIERVDIDRCFFTFSNFTRCHLTASSVKSSNITNSFFHCAVIDMLCDSETDFKETSFAFSRITHPSFLTKAKNFYYHMSCPEEGSFIGWKKCAVESSGNYYSRQCIVKLLIPEDAKRSSAAGRKCRCDKAVVLEIQNCAGARLPDDVVAASYHDLDFTYKVGETVRVVNFDDRRWNECAPGIHFFIDRQEAVDY